MEFVHDRLTFNTERGFGPFEDGSYSYDVRATGVVPWNGGFNAAYGIPPAEEKRLAIEEYENWKARQ